MAMGPGLSIGPRLVQGQRQALVMTPQLQQAIKLLQLSQIDLAAHIEAELEANPLLAVAEEGAPDIERGSPDAISTEPPPDMAAALDRPSLALADGPAESEPSREEYRDLGGDGSAWTMVGAGGGENGDYDPLANVAERAETLSDHLLAQIRVDFTDPGDVLVASRLTGMLDETGYLTADIESVPADFGISRERLEAILARLRRLDPTGVFSRTLAECLAAQLEDRDRYDPAMRSLVANLDLLAKREFAVLARRCGIDSEDLADMIAEIRALDPKPGLRFDPPRADTAVPDVYLRPVRHAELGDTWEIELNSDALPRLLVDRRYQATLARGARGKEDKAFIVERAQAASWLVKALDQRATTILRVTREIVRQQDAFFRVGVSGLRPLVLRDIAVAVEMHESTVSRVTANKYIATPRGTFELKYFFTAAIAGRHGAETVSAESVRARIRHLIDAEVATGILSDDAIVELLGKEKIDIARRTVAKYREAMKIPSSAQRRRVKREIADQARSAA